MRPTDIDWQNDHTPVSKQFNDVYFSAEDGIAESHYVFLAPNLDHRTHDQDQFVIAETGFGTGLNFLLTWQNWQQQDGHLYYISFEQYPLSVTQLQQAHQHWPELEDYSNQLLKHYPDLIAGMHWLHLDEHTTLLLIFGDVNHYLPKLQTHVDAWYLDGFAPSKNPAMWTDTVFTHMARLSRPNHTTMSTFTAASQVRKGLEQAGFAVTKQKGFGRKREMLTAVFSPETYSIQSITKPWFALPPYQKKKQTIHIIGAGMAGCALAYTLCQQGFTVHLYDQQSGPAQCASGNPIAMAKPYFTADQNHADQFYSQGFFTTRRLVQDLVNQGYDLCYQPCGALELATHTRTQNKQQRLIQRGLPTSVLQTVNAKQASEIAAITLQHNGLYLPQAFTLSPASFCRALLDQCENLMCHWQTSINPTDLPPGDIKIIATGAQASSLPQCNELPLIPTAGQLTFIESNPAIQKLRCILSYDGYLLPEYQGQHILGATYRQGCNNTDITQHDHQINLDFLTQCLANTDCHIIGGRSAVRANTPDHMPMIGPISDPKQFAHDYAKLAQGGTLTRSHYPQANYLDNTYLCTGFGSKGLVSCVLAAETLCSLFTGRPLPISIPTYEALHPSRFYYRDMVRGQ